MSARTGILVAVVAGVMVAAGVVVAMAEGPDACEITSDMVIDYAAGGGDPDAPPTSRADALFHGFQVSSYADHHPDVDVGAVRAAIDDVVRINPDAKEYTVPVGSDEVTIWLAGGPHQGWRAGSVVICEA